nr:hypothetical protein [Tanacetum cinerariifolium]
MANLEFCDTHNMVTYLLKIEGSEGFHQIIDFLDTSHIKYALMENPTIYTSLIQQFWQNTAANTLNTGEVQITTTIDGKVKLVSEASIRWHLQLEDSDGAPTTSQPQLSSPSRIPTRQETEVPQPSSPTHTHVADEDGSTGVDVRHGGAATTVSSLDIGQGSVDSLEADLKQTKQIYGAAYTKLIMKVKRLEKTVKSSQVKRRAKIVVSDDEELEDPSKQGRSMIEEIDQDTEVTLVTPIKVLAEVAKVHTYARIRREISTASGGISTDKELVSTVGASIQLVLLQIHERAGYEEAVRLQEQLDEEERQRIARVHEETSSFNVDE